MAEKKPLPTPDLSHFSEKDYENFYEPAQDSFLLLDALWKDQAFLKEQVNPTICAEIGFDHHPAANIHYCTSSRD
jgi:hypothetical protein